ncbi:MAG: tRNA (adenosine(37)-N6)-threonylcarbamoyltransferase complex dimerization subunit type 1 TsaB [Flavobacteriales bacterium]|nr:tRNA (adenosine(37)-N6)-threonylcarbamoyltransferase complex dimerization subunit type 1 TsaB [Flavobacteriales bacterium]
MSYILHLETSSKNCSVVISKDLEVVCSCEEATKDFSHSEKLHTFIEWVLEGAGINIQDLDAVAVGKGPGSYTGLRIGVSTAKGLCFALGIPLISIDTLSILANKYIGKQEYDYIIPVLDARRMELYTTVFNAKTGERVEEIESHILNEKSWEKYRDKSICIVGDCIEKVKNYCDETGITFRNIDFSEELPSAKNMVSLVSQKFKNSEFEDVAYFEPFYLKEFVGNKLKKYR